jgi:hypothetical protein
MTGSREIARALSATVVMLAVVTADAAAQDVDDSDPPAWAFSIGVYTYALPDEGNYAQPTFTADRGALHLEARYNYEAMETGSLWAGYNLAGGNRVTWERSRRCWAAWSGRRTASHQATRRP